MPINRYTDLSVSAYNPMSMEELAVAPMMKRKQHDELDKQLAEATIKVDPLKYHEEEALRLKNELEGKVASQAEQLASQGITPDTKSSFYKLNKEYRDLVAPTGQVGKINRAKEIYDKEHAAFIKNAMETSKIGGDVAEQRWNEHVAKNYTGYEDPEQKRIKYIDPLGTVAYQDQDKDLALAHNILGNYSKEIGDAGYKIAADPVTGLMGVINSKGQTVTKHNLGRVQEALDAYNLKWVDPKGEGRKWSDFAGQNAANNAERFRHQFNSMKIYNTGKENSTSFNPLPGQGGDDENPNGLGLTEASNNFVSDKYSDKNYSDIQNIIDKNKNATTPEGKQAYYEAVSFKNKLDQAISKDPELNNLKKQLDDAQQKFETIKKNPFKTFDNKGKLIDSVHKTEQAKNAFRQSQEASYVNKINKLKEEIDNKSNKYVQANNLESTDYMLTPYTKKQQGILEVANDNIQQLFQSNPENIKSFVNIESVGTSEGAVLHNISPDDKETLAKVLHNAKKGDVVLTRVAGKGVSGKPEYVLRVTPNDESEKLYGSNKFWSKSKINEKPFEIRVSFNKSKSNANVNNVNGLIKDYVSAAGGQGKQLSNTMNLYEKYGNHSYNEFKNDPQLKPLILDLIIKEGDNPNSPYHNMKTEQEGINYFLKHHGNEQIDFHSN